jgi:ubiquinone biosynthesis protein COQ9
MTERSNLPERSPERDAAIAMVLNLVPIHGWSIKSLQQAITDETDLMLLFPGGTPDLIETSCDLADRQMEEDAAAADFEGLGLTKRVRAVIALRLDRQRPNRDAIRRAIAVLAIPTLAPLSARITAHTVDSIWFAAGDRSADFSWYTKRAILAVVYAGTLLFWLRDYGENDAATLEFLDRRLQGVGNIGKVKARIERALDRFKPHRFKRNQSEAV